MDTVDRVLERVIRTDKEGWRGPSFCLVPDQPRGNWFPKLEAFELALRFPRTADHFAGRSIGRLILIPIEEDVDWIVVAMMCDAYGGICWSREN